METLDFEQTLLSDFKKQLLNRFGYAVNIELYDLIGIVSYEEFLAFDIREMSAYDIAVWFEQNNKGNYSTDDILLWRINNMLLFARESVRKKSLKNKCEFISVHANGD